MRYFGLIFLGALLLSSCEGIVGGNGRVISRENEEPLEKVMVILYLDDIPSDTIFSDSSGRFLGSSFVGCVFGCPESKLFFQKPGYQSETIIFNEELKNRPNYFNYRDSMVVFLKRQ